MTDSSAPTDRAKWLVFLIVAVLSLVADQATKIWARASLPVVRLPPETASCVVPDDIVSRACIGHPVSVVDGVWEWRLSMNPGSAFGLLSSQSFARWLFTVVGIGAVIGMFWMMHKARSNQRILHWALALVAGGAVGNLVDRVYFGVVTDFILWRYRTHEWPVFNVADIVLVVGVALMFIDIQKEGRREKALKSERQAKAKAAGLVKI
jgi:signal peptidase II